MLPDPFTFANGRKVTTKAEFECKKKEIWDAFNKYELGDLPPKPESVTGSWSGNTLTVRVTDQGKSISFGVSIRKPSGNGPFPGIIGIGGASIPIPSNVATLTFNNEQIASQGGGNSRGQGLFYQLYGNQHSAGALMAWAWGVDRLVDALETTTGHGIDPTKLGVTGCSRNGKGALIVGAFVPRIALTLPQESGSGGAACWRISDSEKAKGKNIQTASQIIGENVWLSTRFNNYARNTATLPVDHHQLAALVAPRGLYLMENNIDWLGPVSTTACMKTGRLIYKALGVPDNMGFSLVGGNGHCQFPSSQQGTELTAFINKFLLGGTGNTNIERGPSGTDPSTYINWSVPTLT